MQRATVHLKPGHVRPVWAGHPWIFAQGIDRVEGAAQEGDDVLVVDPRKNALGIGFYAPKSPIAVRMVSRDPRVTLNEEFFVDRVARAQRLRTALGLPSAPTNGYRVVHAEGDGLPGLIVDRFGDDLVAQWLSPGILRHREAIEKALLSSTGAARVLDRSPNAAALTEPLRFVERGFAYELPPEVSQKTGYYFDQRPLRERIERLAAGRRVFDGHTFVGAGAFAAARGGASEVLAVDASAPAIEAAKRIADANELGEKVRFEKGDVRKVLAREEHRGAFELVVLDPPPYAPKRGDRMSALDGYAKLAELGSDALASSGFLVLSTCSAAIGLDDLQRSIAIGAAKAGKKATIVGREFQGADHPVPAAFPEGLYLRTLIAMIERDTRLDEDAS
jgi:23S rRNA (cytosine1962-C5)-methyltransferase